MKLDKTAQLAIVVFIGLCIIAPDSLNADTQSFQATYFGSITEDEEGKKICFPSFVFSEPVRKEIYVIDSKARIIVYTSDFFPVFTLSKGNGIDMPQGLAIDGEGNLYVAQSATKENPRHRISVFNACFKWARDIYLEGFEDAGSFIPYRLSVDKKGNIYVAASNFPGILILNNHGRLLEILSIEDEGKKVRINNITLDRAERIYLVSEEEGRIYVYDENKKFLFKFGRKGGSSGKLSRPMAIGVDSMNKKLYVVDYMRHTVSVYDDKGAYLSEFGGLGWDEGWLQYPRDISVDSAGNILVADTFNDRIEVFQFKEQLRAKSIEQR